jgi:hypothetical protein
MALVSKPLAKNFAGTGGGGRLFASVVFTYVQCQFRHWPRLPHPA